MSDPTGGGAAGLLEGLASGVQGGYGFRRRRQLETDLMTLRQQEGAREQARAGREQAVFDEQQAAYKKAEALRSEVAAHLSAPPISTAPLGSPTGIDTPSIGERLRGVAPLSADAQTAQAVGRTLGELGGRDLTGNEALLVGSGEVPYAAIQPKAYHPRTRAEWLDNLRIAAGLRAQAQRLPITLDHAFTTLDRIYTQQDPKTGAWRSLLTPAQRLTVAKKMVAGTVQPADFPDIKGEVPAAATPAPATQDGGVLQRIRDWWSGGAGRGPSAPSMLPPATGGPEDAAGAERLSGARAAIADYRDLPESELQQVLAQQGYSDEEIRSILGSTP